MIAVKDRIQKSIILFKSFKPVLAKKWSVSKAIYTNLLNIKYVSSKIFWEIIICPHKYFS